MDTKPTSEPGSPSRPEPAVARALPIRAGWPDRVPLLMLFLALPTLVVSFFLSVQALSGLASSLRERTTTILFAKEHPLLLSYDTAFLMTPLSRLNKPEHRADLERLSLLVGEDRFEHRHVTLPLCLLLLLLCGVLFLGSTGSLRRRPYGPSLWLWGCLVNIPFAALGMVVLVVRTRTIIASLGRPIAETLSRISGHTVDVELHELTTAAQLVNLGWGVLYCLWVIWLALCAIYLRRQPQLHAGTSADAV